LFKKNASIYLKILAYFQGCLLELYAELKKQFMDAIATVSGAFDGGDDGTAEVRGRHPHRFP
jgi:hypothetical protein